jgi:hypothetical protein
MSRRALLAAASLAALLAAGTAVALLAERGNDPAPVPEEVPDDPSVGSVRAPREWEHRGQIPFSRLDGRRLDVLKAAEGIQIDGDLRDWDGVPSITSAEVLGPGTGARRILAVAVAPTTTRIRAMVRTGDEAGMRIWLDLDRTPEPGFEARVELDPDGTVSLLDRLPGAKDRTRRKVEATVSRGPEGLEVSVPVAALGAPDPRGWVRIRPLAADKGRRIQERGPAIASYVLDVPIAAKRDRDEACSTAPPVLGRWFVAQGPFGKGSHEGEWAYDLGKRDALHEAARVPGSEKAEDSYAWGQAVVVRDMSRVLDARDGIQDHETVGKLSDRAGPANLLQVRLSSGWNLVLAHLRRESLIVAKGESVRAFTKVGSVGNSGMSTGPHLHLAANSKATWPRGAPVRFVEVVVGLNAFDGDPWATYRDSWAVEEGFFFSYVEG